MLEDLGDQKVGVSLLQNSLYTDAPKTTAMIDFFASIEAEAEVSIKRNKTVIHLWHSTTISCKSHVGVVEKKISLLYTADPEHVSEGLSIADIMSVAIKGAKSYFQIAVTNTSSTDMTIEINAVIRKLQLL